ncbi:MAG TPA: hypothetical protein VIL69_02710 [Roseomonas sp.]
MTVQVVIASAVPAFRGATLHVLLEEVGRADAPARPIAEVQLPGLVHPPRTAPLGGGETRVAVALRGPSPAAINPRSDYAVRAWLDRDGDDAPSRGDLFSDQRRPVLTRGFGRAVTLRLGPPSHG